jgi:DNA-binding NtrC family response regulator
LLEVERCRKAFNSRRQPGVLLRQYHRTLPVIDITGDPGHERVQKARTAGAFDVLAKPFGMATLQNLVAQAMRVAPRP